MFEVVGHQAPAATSYQLSRPGTSTGACTLSSPPGDGNWETGHVGPTSARLKTDHSVTPVGWKVHHPSNNGNHYGERNAWGGADLTDTSASRIQKPLTSHRDSSSCHSKGQKATKIESTRQDQEAYSVMGKSMNAKFTKVQLPKNRHRPSYVDETLFGGKEGLQDPGFPAPWESQAEYNKKPQYVFDATDYKAVAARQEEREKSGIPCSHLQPKKTKKLFKSHRASYVDEGLFGPRPVEPDFRAPWDTQKSRKPFIFDTVDYTKPRCTPRKPSTPTKPAWK